MWRGIYAAVAPPAADSSALASEDDGASVVRSAQGPLRSPPGATSWLTMAAASTPVCALVIGTCPVRGDNGGGIEWNTGCFLNSESPSVLFLTFWNCEL